MRKIFFLTFFLQLLCLDLQLSSCSKCGYPPTRGYKQFSKALTVITAAGFHAEAIPSRCLRGMPLPKEVSKVVMNGFTPEVQQAIIDVEKFGFYVLIPIKAS